MNVLSLFDGMSCGQIALNRAGIKYDNYYASEIDKHAIKVTMANYPNTIQLGSVTEVKAENLPKINLLIGGSPCQGFSFAGKQLNFDDPQSKLFFEYVRLLKECKPKYFLLENVKMKKEYQDIISRYLGVEPVAINSNRRTPANRNRLYWTNINTGDFLFNSETVESFLGFTGEIAGTIGTSTSRIVKKMDTFGALTATMWKGIRAAGRPIVIESYCVGKHIDELKKDVDYRMLTPQECERLQTVPDGYTAHVSKTQRYKMLGNGWTVDVIAHIFKGIKEEAIHGLSQN